VTPDASWAEHYDTIFEGSYGECYVRLTSETLACVCELAPPGSLVVDFGAGTVSSRSIAHTC
jgi:hypothetical protein